MGDDKVDNDRGAFSRILDLVREPDAPHDGGAEPTPSAQVPMPGQQVEAPTDPNLGQSPDDDADDPAKHFLDKIQDLRRSTVRQTSTRLLVELMHLARESIQRALD